MLSPGKAEAMFKGEEDGEGAQARIKQRSGPNSWLGSSSREKEL